MKNPGKKFEEDFKASIPANVFYHRIPDSAQSWGEGENIRFTPKSPFDAILYAKPLLLLLELKSTQGTSLPFDKIRDHQIQQLKEANSKPGATAGFVINFRKYGRTFFVNIEDFCGFIGSTTKKSINMDDVIKCGGIEIQAEKKRVRYRYDVRDFTERVKLREGAGA
jgi:recombination protein U